MLSKTIVCRYIPQAGHTPSIVASHLNPGIARKDPTFKKRSKNPIWLKMAETVLTAFFLHIKKMLEGGPSPRIFGINPFCSRRSVQDLRVYTIQQLGWFCFFCHSAPKEPNLAQKKNLVCKPPDALSKVIYIIP